MIHIIQKPTPNFSTHSIPRTVHGLVLHRAEGNEASVDSWFKEDASDVSSHFMVGFDGEIRQYVSVHDIAWHAGRVYKPTWPGLRPGNPNVYTIGIEHEGNPDDPWPEPMLFASSLVSAWCCHRFSLVVDHVTFAMHRQIFARKVCPGSTFDFDDYLDRVRAVRQLLTKADIERIVVGIR